MDVSQGMSMAGDAVDLARGLKDLFNGPKGGVGADFYWKQLELQKQQAQNGIRWRVEDAKAAGIHPLYALGAPTMSASPVSGPMDSAAGSWAQRGQDISRALKATASSLDRDQARLNALTLERGELENELLRSQIAREKAQIGPPLPAGSPALSVQPDVDPDLKIGVMAAPAHVQEKPMERTVGHPDKPYQEPGALPDVGWARTPTGLAPVPSSDVKQRIEDQFIPEIMWSIRNNLLPSIGSGEPPPASMLPPGAVRWQWHLFKQEWQPVFIRKGTKFKDGVPYNNYDQEERRW